MTHYPTRPHLLIVPLPCGPSIQIHESTRSWTYSNHHSYCIYVHTVIAAFGNQTKEDQKKTLARKVQASLGYMREKKKKRNSQ